MRKTLILGFSVLIPVLITIYLINFFLDFVSRPFLALSQKILTDEILRKYIHLEHHASFQQMLAKILSIFFLITLACLIGSILRAFIKYYFMTRPLSYLKKAPFLGWLLKLGLKIGARLLEGKGLFFEKVVLVPFLGRKRYVLGLVSSSEKPSFVKKKNIDRVVFIPTSPHPLSGLLILTEKSALKITKMNTKDAINFIMSCGTKDK